MPNIQNRRDRRWRGSAHTRPGIQYVIISLLWHPPCICCCFMQVIATKIGDVSECQHMSRPHRNHAEPMLRCTGYYDAANARGCTGAGTLLSHLGVVMLVWRISYRTRYQGSASRHQLYSFLAVPGVKKFFTYSCNKAFTGLRIVL